MTSKPNHDVATIVWLLREGRAYWDKLGILFILSLLATPLAMLLPVPLMLTIDTVIGGKPPPAFVASILPESALSSASVLLGLIAVSVVVISVTSELRGTASQLLETVVGQRLLMGFRAQLFDHAQRLSSSYHDAKGTSDTLYRIQFDAPALHSLIVYGVTPFLTAGMTLAGMLYVMWRLDAQIMVLALVIAPAMYVLTELFRTRLRRQWGHVKAAESGAQSVLHEVLGALRVVQAFGREAAERSRFEEKTRRSVRENVRVVALDGLFALLVAAFMAIGTALVLYIGASRVEAGALTVGQLLLVMSYLGQLYAPMTQIGKQVTKIQGWLASADRIREFLHEPPTVTQQPNARRVARVDGGVKFETVSFAYDGVNKVLTDISFEVPPGARVGIVGPTGSGKSTLANLLMRFYDPTSGRIRLDGHDLREYRVTDLRRQFALVLQDSVLFSASIEENIAYGRPGATKPEIVRAAQVANADSFILGLPDGYSTLVGERGMRLSGGQRQRIALARAFLRDAPILLLDEPTSAVDVATESLIMASLEELMRNRTTFMIAHRTSTLRTCDVILQLDPGGRLVSITSGTSGTGAEPSTPVFGAAGEGRP